MSEKFQLIQFPKQKLPEKKDEGVAEKMDEEQLKQYCGKRFLEIISQEGEKQEESLISNRIISPERLEEDRGLKREISINVLFGALQKLADDPNIPAEVAEKIKGLTKHIDTEKSMFKAAKRSGNRETGMMHQMHGRGSIIYLVKELEKIFPEDLIEKFRNAS